MVRLTAIELTNFKNIEHGRIELSSCKDDCFDHADIVGIYGQNGSGKTSIIAALFILKALFEGDALPEGITDESIAKDSDCFAIKCEGVIQDNEILPQVWEYSVTVSRGVSGRCMVCAERVSCRRYTGKKPTKATIFDYEVNDDGGYVIKPKVFWDSLSTLNKNLALQLPVAQALSVERKTSLFFSNNFTKIFKQYLHCSQEEQLQETLSKKAIELISSHAYYVAIINYFVGSFALKSFAVLPPSLQVAPYIDRLEIFSHEGDDEIFANSFIRVNISEPISVTDKILEALERTIDTINGVLGAIVPGLSVAIKDLGPIVLDEGEEGRQIELISNRNGVVVPLRCESEGIKRLVSVLNLLIDVYSKPEACVAIDELDSGIFEYLLGEIVTVLEKHGKGQLIFTAHNLRPLEMISKNSLVFTTTNPNNRYIPFTGLKTTNNLRDQYLRALFLGGQTEEIYKLTDEYTIDNAFYNASITLKRKSTDGED